MTQLDAPRQQSAKERMQCMEIWGGNRKIDKSVEAPGLDIYVHSVPYNESKTGGGDIYYVTSCASGRICRLLLADVSGHGEDVAGIAVSLRDLLRENVNTIDQERFVSQMNREFTAVSQGDKFATAVVATFFEPTKSLSVSVAGHPYPIYYRAAEKRWVHLDPSENDQGPENLPLGIMANSNYSKLKIATETGDMFLFYSDAFSESVHPNNKFVGIDGVLQLLNDAKVVEPSELVSFLRGKIGSMSTSNLISDDATLIVGHVTSTSVGLKNNLLSPFRLMGRVEDNTSLA